MTASERKDPQNCITCKLVRHTTRHPAASTGPFVDDVTDEQMCREKDTIWLSMRVGKRCGKGTRVILYVPLDDHCAGNYEGDLSLESCDWGVAKAKQTSYCIFLPYVVVFVY